MAGKIKKLSRADGVTTTAPTAVTFDTTNTANLTVDGGTASPAGDKTLTITARRDGTDFNNARILFSAPRTSTADTATMAGRGYVVLPGNVTGNDASLFIGPQSANSVTTGTMNDIRGVGVVGNANQFNMEMNSTTGLKLWSNTPANGSNNFSVDRSGNVTANSYSGGLATETTAGLVKKNRWQIRVLPASIGTVTDISTLRFANLTIGNTYRVTLKAYFSIIGTSATEFAEMTIRHGGVILDYSRFRQDLATDYKEVASGTQIIFVATATTVTFNSSRSSTNTIIGTGDLAGTWTMLEELNNYDAATTDFTP